MLLEEHGGVSCDELANQIRDELTQTTIGMTKLLLSDRYCNVLLFH